MRQSDPTKESGSKSIVQMYREAEDEIRKLEAERDALREALGAVREYEDLIDKFRVGRGTTWSEVDAARHRFRTLLERPE